MIMLLPLAPPLALALAALLCHLPALRRRLRWDLAVPLLAGLSLLAAALQLAYLWDGRVDGLRLTLSAWTPSLFEHGPGLHVDLLSALVVVAIALSAFLALLRTTGEEAEAEAAVGPLAVATAALLFAEATISPLGLVASWLLLDVALFFGGRIRRRGLLASQLGLLFVLAGLMGPVDAAGIGGELPSEVRFWLMAAAGIRLGAYPFSWAVPPSLRGAAWRGTLLRMAPTLAGAGLALRVGQSVAPSGAPELLVLAPGVVALGFGGLLAWLAEERRASLDWATSFSAGLVMLAAATGGVGQVAAILLLVDLAVGRSLQLLLDEVPGGLATLARSFGTWSLLGLPPALGFVGRVLLYDRLLQLELDGLLLLVLLASMLAALPSGRAQEPERPVEARPWADPFPLLASIAVLLLGLWPAAFPVGLGAASGPLPPAEWSGIGVPLLAAILLPPIAGYGLKRAGWLVHRAPADSRRLRYSRVLGLTEIFDALRTALIQSGRALHRSLGLVEGHRAMALTLLAAVAVGMSLMAGAGPAPNPAGVNVLGIGLWGAAVLVAATNLFVTLRLVTLIVLLAAYLLAGSSLMLTGAEPMAPSLLIGALVKPLAGIVVVAILAISVLQLAREPVEGGRSPLLVAEPSDRSETLQRVLALAIAVLIVGSLQSTTLPDKVPEILLRPALTLVAGGLLTAIFARSPLRLAVSVLMALTGFELIYARLDPGLFMTGGLAAFHILFAILASLFVGQALDEESV